MGNKGNPTIEKLQGLPFSSATELKSAQKEVSLAVWRKLETAKAFNDLVDRPEYDFWRAEFETGFVCGYGDNSEQLVRVFSSNPGIKVEINRELASSMPSSENIITALIEPMNKSFAETYYKAKGILPSDEKLLAEKAKVDNAQS